MDELKPIRCGCGGEAKVVFPFGNTDMYLIECDECGICTSSYNTEAEAIKAWNTAMGGTSEMRLKAFWDGMAVEMKEERTAKVDAGHKSVITGVIMDGHCKNCGRYVMDEDDYCPGCGARLEWK